MSQSNVVPQPLKCQSWYIEYENQRHHFDGRKTQSGKEDRLLEKNKHNQKGRLLEISVKL